MRGRILKFKIILINLKSPSPNKKKSSSKMGEEKIHLSSSFSARMQTKIETSKDRKFYQHNKK